MSCWAIAVMRITVLLPGGGTSSGGGNGSPYAGCPGVAAAPGTSPPPAADCVARAWAIPFQGSCVQARPGGARMFLARQPPPPGGFRGAPSVHQGGHRPPRTALDPASSSAPRGPSRRPVRLVLGRAPGNSARRRAACRRAAAPTRIAAVSAPAGAPRLLVIRLVLTDCSDARSYLLTQDVGGRPRSGVLSQFGPKVRRRS